MQQFFEICSPLNLEGIQWLSLFAQATGFFFILFAVTSIRSRKCKFGDFEIIGENNDLCSALARGAELFPTSGFAIPTSPPMVVLPIKMIDEVKSLPENKASAARELFKRAAGHYSKMGTNTVAAIKALKIDLNRKATMIPIIQEETEYAFKEVIGVCHNWKRIPTYSKINRVVAIVSGRMFLGKTLSRHEEWISLTTEWSNDVFSLLTTTTHYPNWLRPYITPYLSQTKRVLQQRARAKAFLGPLFIKQLEAKLNGIEWEEEEESLATWMLKYITPRHMRVESLVRHQLGISWASIHTTTQALTHIIYDLATRPEYQQPLREELEAVLWECDGLLTRADLVKLRNMDSFMKESMRVNPATIVAPMRLAVEPLTLTTGQTIPAGISFGFSNMEINNSKTLYSSPSPEIFDGFRFAKMRQKEGEGNRHQFGATGPTETFDFGHGTHACPGRFFAGIEIKLLLAYILQNYDLKLKEGESRPQSVLDDVWFNVNQTAEILFKSR